MRDGHSAAVLTRYVFRGQPRVARGREGTYAHVLRALITRPDDHQGRNGGWVNTFKTKFGCKGTMGWLVSGKKSTYWWPNVCTNCRLFGVTSTAVLYTARSLALGHTAALLLLFR